MTWLLIPICAVFVFYYASTIRKVGVLTADSLFVYLQLLMALGSLPLLDPSRTADKVYGYVLAYTLTVYMVLSAILHARWKTGSTKPENQTVTTFRPGFHSWLLIFLSTAIIILYFRAIGYVALFNGIANARSGGSTDVAGLRLDSYSGSSYFFPGYVNQFKNAVLPSLSVLAIIAWLRSGRRPWLYIAALSSFSVLGLLGTGQRGAFVLFVVIAVTFVHMLDRRAFPRRAVLVVVLAIPLILLSTFALGRSSGELTATSSTFERGHVALVEFQGRIFESNQNSAVQAFRYIYEDTAVQNGAEWIASVKGLLPGNTGSDLANRIYERIYGTARGTAPESIWGSIYHNFGMTGIILSPILLAILIGNITRISRTEKERNTLELMGIAGVSTVVGFWVTSSPVALLNSGLCVYVLMWVVGARTARSAQKKNPSLSRTS